MRPVATRTALSALAVTWALLSVLPPAMAGAAEPELPKVAVVEKAPAVDGALGEEAWAKSLKLKFGGYCDQARRDKGEKPKDATEARLVTDRENLYVAFRCEESHAEGPWLYDGVKHKYYRGRNYQVLGGDYAALALDLGKYGFYNYYFIAISPKGDVYRCFTWPHRYDLILNEQGLPKITGAAKIDKAGKCWTAELKIPLKELLRHPADGLPKIVGADLRRVQWGGDRGTKKLKIYWTRAANVSGKTQNTQYDHMATWKPLFKTYPSYSESYSCGRGWVQATFAESFGHLRLEAGKIDNKLVSGQGKRLIGLVDGRIGWDRRKFDKMAKTFDVPRMEQWDDARPAHPTGKPKVIVTPPIRRPGRKPGFAAKPSATRAGKETRISFKVSEPVDVTVAILDAKGKIVRHLASGVLGKNPPQPFKPDSLDQVIAWDHKNDAGKPVSPKDCKVQVSLGLTPKFHHAITLKKNWVDKDKWPVGLDVENLPSPPDPKKAWPPNHSGYAFGGTNYMGLDRARDELYIQGCYVHAGASGKLLRELKLKVSSEAPFGGRRRGNGEIVVGPAGQLYASGANEIWQFDRQGQPVNFPAVGRSFIPELWGAHSNPHRGTCVGPDGDIYRVHHYQPHCNPTNQVTRVSPDGRIKKYGFIEMRCCAAGVKVDRRGNVYVGCTVQPAGALPPEKLAGKLPKELLAKYPRIYGSILKFGPEGGMVKADPKGKLVRPGPKGMIACSVEGAAWIHPGFSPLLSRIGDSRGGPGCSCRNARFDLDGFGRLFIPDAPGGRVEVIDSNANTIAFFGRRGQPDRDGVELGWGTQVAASDRACYVADYLRYRVVRVKLEYAVEETCAVR